MSADVDPDSLPELPPELGPLNPRQHQAVTTTEGPLLILAGAGSGKTRVLTRRVAYLLRQGVDPSSILAVTFTNKAAGEMKERVIELVGREAEDVWVHTFHATCVRILRSDAEPLGYTKRFAIYDDDDQIRVIRQAIRDQGYDPKTITARQVMSTIDRYKNQNLSVDQVVREQRARRSEPAIRIWETYEEALMIADAMDFNDLIGKTVELFEQHPEVRDRWRDRFRYVLVDEYQDTNHSQYRLLRLLTGAHGNLAVVGDDDQSIYGFRGADIRNIHDFQKDHPQATIIPMEQNYRCSPTILALANAVVAKAEQRIAKRLWTDRTDREPVQFLCFDNPFDEARGVARLIAQIAREERRPWSDFAVIYRTNAMSQPFELAFGEAQIPAKVVGGRRFYSRREIRDALAWMRLLATPTDDAAFMRIINVPPRGIGPVTLKALREQATERGDPLLKTARAIAEGGGRQAKVFARFIELVDHLVDRAVQLPLPELLHDALVSSGYLAMLEEEGGPEARERRDNLHALLQDASAYEHDDPQATPLERLGGWLDRISLSGADEEIPEDGQVVLTTVHTAKGLEYPVVFVVRMAEGRFPHHRSLEEARGVDEERRLAYVAFTRAQHRLFVSRPRHEPPTAHHTSRRAGERPRPEPVAPSRFLYGAPKDSCVGEVPELERAQPSPVDRSSRRRDAVTKVRADLATFLQGRPPDPSWGEHEPEPEPVDPPRPTQAPVLPEHTYRVRDIQSLDDLRPGVRVVHPRAGVGEVVEVAPPHLWVQLSKGIATFSVGDPDLAILVD